MSTLFVKEASKSFQQMTKQTSFVVIGALRVINNNLKKELCCFYLLSFALN